MDSKTNRTLGVFALLLALVGGFVMLKKASGDAEASTPRVVTPVLVSTRHIVAGTSVADILDDPDDWVEEIRLPVDAVFPDTLTGIDELARRGDQVIVADINAGAQFREVALLTPGEQVSSAIAAPEESLEITIVMSPDRAVGARLLAGHQVAIVASVEATPENHSTSRMIAHNVLITNVELRGAEDLQTGNGLAFNSSSANTALDIGTTVQSEAHITLSGSVEMMEKIVLAQDKARIVLVRQHDGVSVAGSSAVTMYDLLGLETPEVQDPSEVDYTKLTPEDLTSSEEGDPSNPDDEPDLNEIEIVIDLGGSEDDENGDGETDTDDPDDADNPDVDNDEDDAAPENDDAEPAPTEQDTQTPAADDETLGPQSPVAEGEADPDDETEPEADPPAPGGGGFVLPENTFGLAGFGPQ